MILLGSEWYNEERGLGDCYQDPHWHAAYWLWQCAGCFNSV